MTRSPTALPLTVRCPCGVATPVRAGGSVTCDCGRTWDTDALPGSDLDGIRATLRRYRRQQLLFVGTLLLLVAVLAFVSRSAPAPLALLAAGVIWLRFCAPWWRARGEQRLRDLPTWTLRARGAPRK